MDLVLLLGAERDAQEAYDRFENYQEDGEDSSFFNSTSVSNKLKNIH